MKGFGLDLSSYDDVEASAEKIYETDLDRQHASAELGRGPLVTRNLRHLQSLAETGLPALAA